MASDRSELSKLSRERVVDDARRSLETAILTGHMRPGERLAETRLRQQLGVSSTTVREALLMLERQGLVVTMPRRGTFVTRLSAQDARDICYMRALLESFALSAGYSRIDDVVLGELAGRIDEMAACTLPGDLPRLIQLDTAFHGPLVASAGSARITELWAGLDGLVGSMMLRTIESHEGTVEYVVALHQRLLEALAAGDPDRAVAAVIDHYIYPESLNASAAQETLALARLIAGQYASRSAGEALDLLAT